MQVASILAASMSNDNAKIWRVMGRRIDRNKPGQGLKVEILEMSRVRLQSPDAREPRDTHRRGRAAGWRRVM